MKLMHMARRGVARRATLTATLVVLAGVTAAAQSSVVTVPSAKGDETPLTLTGCVIQGERDSFLVNNMTVGGAGAASAPAGAYYRFNTNKGFKDHVNHKVEISGTADFDDIDKGSVTTRTNSAGETTTTVNSERRNITAPTPTLTAVGTAGTEESEVKVKVNTYKFTISDIKMVSSTCS
jgi:hypothetical protein